MRKIIIIDNQNYFVYNWTKKNYWININENPFIISSFVLSNCPQQLYNIYNWRGNIHEVNSEINNKSIIN